MKKLLAATLLITAALAGCASVPMASLNNDNQAKTFQVKQDRANIYVYRNEHFGAAIPMSLALDGKMTGRTGAMTYAKWEVLPGKHEISSISENTSKLSLNAEAGKNYFIWQEVKMGMWQARSLLQEVDPTAGMAAVKECKLISDQE